MFVFEKIMSYIILFIIFQRLLIGVFSEDSQLYSNVLIMVRFI